MGIGESEQLDKSLDCCLLIVEPSGRTSNMLALTSGLEKTSNNLGSLSLIFLILLMEISSSLKPQLSIDIFLRSMRRGSYWGKI